jgi:hypothetical protein
MSRAALLGLSVVDCLFGLLSLSGPDDYRGVALAINFGLAIVLAIFAGRDLMERGIRLGWLAGLSYLAAPLVGLVLYAIFSTRPKAVTTA